MRSPHGNEKGKMVEADSNEQIIHTVLKQIMA